MSLNAKYLLVTIGLLGLGKFLKKQTISALHIT